MNFSKLSFLPGILAALIFILGCDADGAVDTFAIASEQEHRPVETAGPLASGGQQAMKSGPMSERCFDGIWNDDETDVDCGGLECYACALGRDCLQNRDCVCWLCEDDVCAPCGTGVIAADDAFVGTQGSPLSFNVLLNDECDIDPNSLRIAADPTSGFVRNDGRGQITFFPLANFAGTDEFTYRVCSRLDPRDCDEATVTVAFEALLDAPCAEASRPKTYYLPFPETTDHLRKARPAAATASATPSADPVVFFVDDTAHLTITSPSAGASVRTPTPTVSGTAGPGSEVHIFIDGVYVDTVIVDEDGNWSWSSEDEVEDGPITITVQTDSPSGTREDSVSFDIDTSTTEVTVDSPSDGELVGKRNPSLAPSAGSVRPRRTHRQLDRPSQDLPAPPRVATRPEHSRASTSRAGEHAQRELGAHGVTESPKLHAQPPVSLLRVLLFPPRAHRHP